jgi:hypothetical protein
MTRLLTAALLLAALTGCAPATLQGLREKPTGTGQFEVDQNYQQVYRTVITNARKCWQSGLITAQMVVTGDLFTDTKAGEVTVALHGAAGVDTYLGVDIKAVADDRTQVRTYYAMSSWAAGPAAIESWVRTGSTTCSGK